MTETAEGVLYKALVAACEQYGFLSDYSYDLIQDLMSSLQTEPQVITEGHKVEA